MVRLTSGDLLRANAQALVNAVNCVGVMGRGIAAQFKRQYPRNFHEYALACKRGEVAPGKMFVVQTGQVACPQFIVNFPTKRHWRDSSRMEDVESGLFALAEEVERRGIRSIAIPPLGCGLGGLRWEDVRPRIEEAFVGLPDVLTLVFEPQHAASARMRS